MEEALLYKRVRDLKDKRISDDEIISRLEDSGYQKNDIYHAFIDYYKDEYSTSDDKLITTIESRFSRGENLHNIMSDLAEKGYSYYDIQKAALRADIKEGESISRTMGRWNMYTYMNALIFLAVLLLAIFYKPIFFIAVAFIILEWMASTLKSMEGTRNIDTNIQYDPLLGRSISQGIFGYSRLTGGYVRWWIFDQDIGLAIFFLFFSIFSVAQGGYFLMVNALLASAALMAAVFKPLDD